MQPTDANLLPPQRVKFIFNPLSGGAGAAPNRLEVILTAMQAAALLPEVYLVQPEHDLRLVVKDALAAGHRMFVVCGGDGTIDSVAAALAGTRATLGIVPAGTRNNVAYSLGLPDDPVEAVGLLRAGQRLKIDVGQALCGNEERTFLEACSVGLLSALFPAADDLQHGNLARLGDLLSTLISSPVAEMHLLFDRQPVVEITGHVLVAANMPFVGPRFQISPQGSLHDGLLEVVVFADQSKLNLLGGALSLATGGPEDERIRRFHVRRVAIQTNPPMPVVLDGFPFGEGGALTLSVRRRALNVIAGREGPRALAAPPPPGEVAKPQPEAAPPEPTPEPGPAQPAA